MSLACWACVNGTGEGVIEFVLELADVIRLLVPLRIVDEVVGIHRVDRKVLSDSKVSYAAKKLGLGSSVFRLAVEHDE